MSDLYGPADEAESIATIHAALDAGITLLDTGDYYGMGHNELLIREALRGPRPRAGRDQRQVRRPARSRRAAGSASTGARRRSRTSSPTRCAGSAPTTSTSTGSAASTPRCRSRRRSARSPRWCEAGYVRHIGLSEVGAETIRRAHAVAPDLRPADRVLADLARDRGRDPADLPRARHRHHRLRRALARAAQRPLVAGPRDRPRGLPRHAPRFSGENLERNLALVEALRAIAEEKGATVAQVAIAWVLSRGERHRAAGRRAPRERLAEALGALDARALGRRPRARSSSAVPAGAAAGERYDAQQMAILDSERG